MSWVLELVEKAMEEIIATPARALDEDFDIFAEVEGQLPKFKEWREAELEKKVVAEDGQTEIYIVKEVLRAARKPPEDSGNHQATATTLVLLEKQARRCIEKMHDKRIALADKLTSQNGVNAFSRYVCVL